MPTLIYTPVREVVGDGGTLQFELQNYDRLPKTKSVQHLPLKGGVGETVFYNREVYFNCATSYVLYDQIDYFREWEASSTAGETFTLDPYDNATTPGTYQLVKDTYSEVRFGNQYYIVSFRLKQITAPTGGGFSLGGGGGGGPGGSGSPAVGDHYWDMDVASGAMTDSVGALELAENYGGANVPQYSQPSLLANVTGNSIRYNTIDSHKNSNLALAYQNGFTVEAIVKVDALAERLPATNDKVGYCIYGTHRTFADRPGFVMWFDNFNNNLIEDVFPCFTITNDIYTGGSTYANIEAEVRSATALVLGNTYHLLATIRPSNNTIEFWVNGASVGSTSFAPAWFTVTPLSATLLDGSAPTVIEIGASDGFFSEIGDSTIDNVKIHLLEADDVFVTQQVVAANYTGSK